MKNFIKLFLLIILLIQFNAQAEVINIVVPVPSGGGLDTMARDLSSILADNGIKSIVSNHPGADGEIARDFVFKTKDNVIMVGGNTHWIVTDFINRRENRYLNNMNIFGPVFISPYTFITSPKGFTSLNDLLQEAKQKPTPCGVVTAKSRLDLLLMNIEYDTKFVPVPYKGTVNVIPDLGGESIKCVYNSVGGLIPLINDGRMRVLGGNQKIAIESYIDKSVFPNIHMYQWVGFAIPTDGNLSNDKKIVDILNTITNQPEKLKSSLDNGYFLATPSKNTKKMLEKELEQLSKIKNFEN